jgi:hypothetical protein
MKNMVSFALIGGIAAAVPVMESYEFARSCDPRHELCGPEKVILPDGPHSHSGVTLYTSSPLVRIATSVAAGSFFKVY